MIIMQNGEIHATLNGLLILTVNYISNSYSHNQLIVLTINGTCYIYDLSSYNTKKFEGSQIVKILSDNII